MEYLACEATVCELEAPAKALARRERYLKAMEARKGTHYAPKYYFDKTKQR